MAFLNVKKNGLIDQVQNTILSSDVGVLSASFHRLHTNVSYWIKLDNVNQTNEPVTSRTYFLLQANCVLPIPSSVKNDLDGQ